jgi:hypothetical protein
MGGDGPSQTLPGQMLLALLYRLDLKSDGFR